MPNALLSRLCIALTSRPRHLLLAAVVLATPLTLAAEPRLTAKAAILLDAETGEILYSRDPHLPLPPASTTKVLSALIAIERLDPNARVKVSAAAAAAPPSRVGLRAGDTVPAADLLYGMLLKSGNDASEVTAEAVGGTVPDFARLMNARARQLGALDSHFNNPHGLPDDSHVSSAYDLAVIFRYAMLNPTFAQIVATRSAWVRVSRAGGDTAQPVPVANHNRLLGSYEGAMGGKTGFTVKAKRCFVGETERGNTRLIVAVLGSSALWEDVRNLFDYGFEQRGLATPRLQVVKAVQRDDEDEPHANPAAAKHAATALLKHSTVTLAPHNAARAKPATTAKAAPADRAPVVQAKAGPGVRPGTKAVAVKPVAKPAAAARTAQKAPPAKPVVPARKVARDDRRPSGGRG